MILRALGARTAILQFIPALVVFAALWPLARPVAGVGDTFQFWYAGHLVVTGASPYDQSAWHAAGALYGPVADNVARNCGDPNALVCVWAYPPITAWLFAPFGLLPVDVGSFAVNVFVLVTLLVGAVAAVFAFGPREPGLRALMLAASVAGHPFIIDIRAGHFVGLLLLALVAIAYGLREPRAWAVVAGALALALKPHVAAVVGATVPVVLAMRGAWRTFTWVAAVLLVIAGAALARSPESIEAILGRGGAKAAIAWSTTWGLADATGLAVVTLAVIGAVAAAAAFLAVRRAPRAQRDLTLVAVVAAVSLVVTPYAQPYDFLLVLPALSLAALRASERLQPLRSSLVALVIGAWVLGTWGPIVFGQLAKPVSSSYALLPVAALALLAVARTEP